MIMFLPLLFSLSFSKILFSLTLLFTIFYMFCFYGWVGIFNLISLEMLMMLTLILITFLLSFILMKEEFFVFLLICFFSIWFFFTSNLMIFYICFECSMMPILIMIFIWGSQPERVSASFYLLIYALLGALPMMILLTSMSDFNNSLIFLKSGSSLLIFFSLLGFLVKTPIFILHVWLPKAHVEAPTIGSIILAGLLLKLGTFGIAILLFFSINFFSFFMLFIALMGSIFSPFLVSFSTDVKQWVAVSSVVHMNILLIGLFFLLSLMKENSFFIMVFHGVSSSLMFFFMGMMIHSFNNRMSYYVSSWNSYSMKISLFVIMSNIGIPPMLSSFSEILHIVGVSFFSQFFIWFWFIILTMVGYYNIFMLQYMFLEKSSSLSYSISEMIFIIIFIFFFFNFLFLSWLF